MFYRKISLVDICKRLLAADMMRLPWCRWLSRYCRDNRQIRQPIVLVLLVYAKCLWYIYDIYLSLIYTITMKHNRSLSIIKDRKAKMIFLPLAVLLSLAQLQGLCFLNSQQSRATVPGVNGRSEVSQVSYRICTNRPIVLIQVVRWQIPTPLPRYQKQALIFG